MAPTHTLQVQESRVGGLEEGSRLVGVMDAVVLVRDAVVVVVEVAVVTDAISVRVRPLLRAQWEGVFDVDDAVPVVVLVRPIADAIAVRVRLFAAVQREGVHHVPDAVAVVVGVLSVPDAVAVRVPGFERVQRNFVRVVGHAVAVVVRIRNVAGAVGIGIQELGRVVRKDVECVEDAVGVRIEGRVRSAETANTPIDPEHAPAVAQEHVAADRVDGDAPVYMAPGDGRAPGSEVEATQDLGPTGLVEEEAVVLAADDEELAFAQRGDVRDAGAVAGPPWSPQPASPSVPR